MMSMAPTMVRSLNVAVIGAGAAGLACAKELSEEGHKVVVFERGSQLGGGWIYSPDVETDPIAQEEPNRSVVHSSLYSSLRTNIPREAMGFRDFPFVATEEDGRDSRRFPSHTEVLKYLEDFANCFHLNELIECNAEVTCVGLESNGKWVVKSNRKRQNSEFSVVPVLKEEEEEEAVFDAVVVCSGHYTVPNTAKISGIEEWPGRQIHSHSYRVPEPFRDLIVVVIGGFSSAEDISREVASVAKEVHVGASLSATKQTCAVKLAGYENLWQHSVVVNANADGTIAFEDGSVVPADVIIHCTGYKYIYPFLKINTESLSIEDERVGPLYKHVFPPALAPGLSFVGIPARVIPFPLFELQSRWIARVLSGRVEIPSQEKMMKDVSAYYEKLESEGVPKRHTHFLGFDMFQYNDWLAGECGCLPSEEWRQQMFYALLENKLARPETYRDEWDD